MKKKQSIIITEYDRVIPENGNPREGEGFKSIPDKAFDELERFIEEYNDTSQSDSLDFFGVSRNRHLGKYISAKNYVGLIELRSNYQIQILPKLELGETLSETQAIFRKMLSSMKDFPAKISNNASLREERMNLYEVFIDMYLSEVQKLIKRGLKSSYISEENNLNKVKGKILIKENIKYNSAHKERFYVRYDEYQVNRPENRLIKSTLLKLKSLTESENTANAIRRLLACFDGVDESINFEKDFAKINIDRNMKNYENLIKWSKVFLLNKSFTTFSGKTEARALLFPMEKLFEAYVAQELGKVLDSGWRLSTQDTGFYLFDNPRIFGLRPDLVLKSPNGKVFVMDTKWKKLFPDVKNKYGISQADMYQMYAYSKKYRSSDIWVLYPETMDMNNSKEIKFTSNLPDGENTTIHLFFVNMGFNKMEESMNELFGKVKDYDRTNE